MGQMEPILYWTLLYLVRELSVLFCFVLYHHLGSSIMVGISDRAFDRIRQVLPKYSTSGVALPPHTSLLLALATCTAHMCCECEHTAEIMTATAMNEQIPTMNAEQLDRKIE